MMKLRVKWGLPFVYDGLWETQTKILGYEDENWNNHAGAFSIALRKPNHRSSLGKDSGKTQSSRLDFTAV